MGDNDFDDVFTIDGLGFAADTTRTTLDNCLVGLETGFVGLISGFVDSLLNVGGGFTSITDVDGRWVLGITFDGSDVRARAKQFLWQIKKRHQKGKPCE